MERERRLSNVIKKGITKTALAVALIGSHDTNNAQATSIPHAKSIRVHTSEMPFQKGLDFTLWGGGQNPDPNNSTNKNCKLSYYCQQSDLLFKRAKSDGFTSVSFDFPLYMDSAESSSVHPHVEPNNGTPSNTVLEMLTETAHADGLKVEWRPMIDEQNLMKENPNNWRGNIHPEHPELWMKSYTNVIMQYPSLAQQEKVEVFSVGVELNSQEQNPGFVTLINDVKKEFSGADTYSWNWSEKFSKQNLQMQSDLTYASLDEFQDLRLVDTPSHHPTVTDVFNAQKAVVNSIKQMKSMLTVPLVLGEYGLPSQLGGIVHPWHWTDTSLPSALDDQANYFQASNMPGGIFDQVNGVVALGDGPFDPQPHYYSYYVNSDAIMTAPPKPVERVIRQIFATR